MHLKWHTCTIFGRNLFFNKLVSIILKVPILVHEFKTFSNEHVHNLERPLYTKNPLNRIQNARCIQ